MDCAVPGCVLTSLFVERMTVPLCHFQLSSGLYALPGKAMMEDAEDEHQRFGKPSAS